jgi:hypothetical protein
LLYNERKDPRKGTQKGTQKKRKPANIGNGRLLVDCPNPVISLTENPTKTPIDSKKQWKIGVFSFAAIAGKYPTFTKPGDTKRDTKKLFLKIFNFPLDVSLNE